MQQSDILPTEETNKAVLILIEDFFKRKVSGKLELNFQQGLLKHVNKVESVF